MFSGKTVSWMPFFFQCLFPLFLFAMRHFCKRNKRTHKKLSTNTHEYYMWKTYFSAVWISCILCLNSMPRSSIGRSAIPRKCNLSLVAQFKFILRNSNHVNVFRCWFFLCLHSRKILSSTLKSNAVFLNWICRIISIIELLLPPLLSRCSSVIESLFPNVCAISFTNIIFWANVIVGLKKMPLVFHKIPSNYSIRISLSFVKYLDSKYVSVIPAIVNTFTISIWYEAKAIKECKSKTIESIHFVTRWIEHIVPFVLCQTVRDDCLLFWLWGC